MIENTVVQDAGDGATDVVKDVDMNKFGQAYCPKGYERVATVKEQENPSPTDGGISNY